MIPRCPACGGSRQAFLEDYDSLRQKEITVHIDNGCELCDEQGRSWGGVLVGGVLQRLAGLAPRSVSCVVTSPPYWSLRKYAAPDVVWGGTLSCGHEWGDIVMGGESFAGASRWQHNDSATGHGHGVDEGITRASRPDAWQSETAQGQFCSRCGAWRGQFGLEPTPELYVEHTLDVLRGIRRVLRNDGVVWWNIGDGYSHGGAGARNPERWPKQSRNDHMPVHAKKNTGLKPKDLVLMPSRIALAAQADGWWVRSVVIWSKPNAMPESTEDRPTTAHEYVLLLTKSARYWYDAEAIREPHTAGHLQQHLAPNKDRGDSRQFAKQGLHDFLNPNGRNCRSVWTFPTAQTPEAHFATFPPELPRRCIEAATPREVCYKCGLARVRLVDVERPPDYDPTIEAADPKFREAMAHRGKTANSRPLEKIFADSLGSTRNTIGWSNCACEEPDYQPGIVLDPFAGTGTSLWVARQLGRRYIGIELSEEYAEMARTKLEKWWDPPTVKAKEPPEGQAVLPLAVPQTGRTGGAAEQGAFSV